MVLSHEDFLDAIYKYMNRGDQEFLALINVEAVALDGSGEHWNSPALNLEIEQIRMLLLQRE